MTTKGKMQVAIDLLLQHGFTEEAEILKGNDLRTYIGKKYIDNLMGMGDRTDYKYPIDKLKDFFDYYDETFKE